MAFSLFELKLKDKICLKIARFNVQILLILFMRISCMHMGTFPNNDEVPQYFHRMSYAQFRENMDPNYIDT
jgi:hypothetical protein